MPPEPRTRAIPAQAREAQHLVAHLLTQELLLFPLALLHGRIGGRQVAGHRKDQAHGQFGHADAVGAGRVHHDDASRRRGLDVHVVHAHTGAAHDAQLGRGFENFLRHLGLGTHDHRLDIGDEREQFRLGKPLVQHRDLKLGPLFEQLNSLR